MFCEEEIDLRGCYPARPLVSEDNTPPPPQPLTLTLTKTTPLLPHCAELLRIRLFWIFTGSHTISLYLA